MKRYRSLAALLLAFCLLAGGCQLFSVSSPGDNPPPTTDEPPESGPEPERLSLPEGGGVNWGGAPSQAVGTGGDKVAIDRPLYAYVMSNYSSYDYTYNETPDERGIALSVSNCTVTGLRNQILQNRLNSQITARVQEYTSAEPTADLAALAAQYGASSAHIERYVAVFTHLSGRVITLRFTLNDSLKLLDANGDAMATDEWVELESRQECLMYDLYDGRQLKLSDLFFDGAEYPAVIDRYISRMLQEDEDTGYLKRPFRGLPDNYPYLWADNGYLILTFPRDNPYSLNERYFSIPPDELYGICSILYEDPSPYLSDTAVMERSGFVWELSMQPVPFEPAVHDEGSASVVPRIRSGVAQDVAERINAQLDAFEAHFTTTDYLPAEIVAAWDVWDGMGFSVDYSASGGLLSINYQSSFYGPDYSSMLSESLLFDLRTGDRLTAADILLPSDELTELLRSGGITQPLAQIDELSVSFNFDVTIPLKSLNSEWVSIPNKHFNFAFFESEENQ